MGILNYLLRSRHRQQSRPASPLPQWSPRPPLKHYLEYIEPIKANKRAGNLAEAKRLALLAVESTEDESRTTGTGVAPWYYQQVAIICRKQRDRAGELAILERYVRQQHAVGVKPAQLMERLERLKKMTE